MSGGRLVDILDAEGHPLFRNLLDDGSNVMRFASGHGFVTRDECDRLGWTVVDADVTCPGCGWFGTRQSGISSG